MLNFLCMQINNNKMQHVATPCHAKEFSLDIFKIEHSTYCQILYIPFVNTAESFDCSFCVQ